jgi:hypothetical protein
MGNYKVWEDPLGFVRVKVIGDHTDKDSENVISEINEVLLKESNNSKIIIDMTETGRPTANARKNHAKNMKNNGNFKKAALYGASAMNRVMANFIIKASGRGDKVKYFKDEQSALAWINQ